MTSEYKDQLDLVELVVEGKLITNFIDEPSADQLCALGMKYRLGQGVSKDFIKARRYYLLAVEKGSPDAAYNLAELYNKGKGVAIDKKKVDKWFEKSIELHG